MNRHDHRAPAGEPRGRAHDESADRSTVEALPFDRLRAAERGGVEAGNRRARPAGDGVVANVDRVRVARALRAVHRDRQVARVLVPHEPAHAADRRARARQRLAGGRIVETQHADAGLVRDHRERRAVRRQGDRLDVPVSALAEIFDRARRDIEPCEPAEFAVAIRRQEEALAVAGEIEIAGGDRPPGRAPFRRQHPASRAARDIHHPYVGLVDRPVFDHREPPVVEGEREVAPAGAGERRDPARPRGSERIEQREIERRMLAPAASVDVRRFDEQPVARARDPRGRVLARRVGQQHRLAAARIQPIQLRLLVASGIAREDQHVRGLRPPGAETHGLGEIGELDEIAAGIVDAVQLRRAGRAPRDDQFALARMPAHRGRGPEFGIGRDLCRERGGDRRYAVRLQIGVRGDDVRGRRAGGAGEREHERDATEQRVHRRDSHANGW